MIILDVETTGINPQKNSIIDIGALNYLDPSQQFHIECQMKPGSDISDQALVINGRTRESLTDPKLPGLEYAVQKFYEWSHTTHGRDLAGHNIGSFDIPFLKEAFDYADIKWDFGHRSLDLHTLAFFHASNRGIYIPTPAGVSGMDSSTVQSYVGIPEEPRPHIGINGAIWEAECFHRLLEGKPLLDQFKEYPIPNYLKK